MAKVWIVRILQGILSAGFIMAGASKFAMGSDELKKMYTEPLGYGVEFMYVIGTIELLSAILLIIGYWNVVFAVAGAVALAVVMAGATISVLLSDEGIAAAVSPFVWVVVSVIVILGRWSSALQGLKKSRTA